MESIRYKFIMQVLDLCREIYVCLNYIYILNHAFPETYLKQWAKEICTNAGAATHTIVIALDIIEGYSIYDMRIINHLHVPITIITRTQAVICTSPGHQSVVKWTLIDRH